MSWTWATINSRESQKDEDYCLVPRDLRGRWPIKLIAKWEAMIVLGANLDPAEILGVFRGPVILHLGDWRDWAGLILHFYRS